MEIVNNQSNELKIKSNSNRQVELKDKTLQITQEISGKTQNGIDELKSDYVFPRGTASQGKSIENGAVIPKQLIKQVLHEQSVRECYETAEKGFIEEVKLSITSFEIDLNKDKKPDYLIQVGRCAGTSTAPTYIYTTVKEHQYRMIYKGINTELGVRDNKTNRFYDVLSLTHITVSQMYHELYKYENDSYKAVKCGVAETVKGANGEDEQQIKPEKCVN